MRFSKPIIIPNFFTIMVHITYRVTVSTQNGFRTEAASQEFLKMLISEFQMIKTVTLCLFSIAS
jgi:hypothetical protein